MNQGPARPVLAVVAWVLAAAALLASVWVVVGPGRPWRQWPTPSALAYSVHGIHHTISARGVTAVKVKATAASVEIRSLAAGANTIVVTGQLPAGLTVQVVRQGAEVIVTQKGDPSGVFPFGFAKGGLDLRDLAPVLIRVAVPPVDSMSVSDEAGSVTVQGRYHTLAVSDQAGSVTVTAGAADLKVSDQAGAITVTDTSKTAEAVVSAQAGPVTFSGQVTGTAVITDQLGPVTVALTNPVRTRVRVRVQLGAFSSQFAGLRSGTNGTFSGMIGAGGAGTARVVITSQLGPVVLNR